MYIARKFNVWDVFDYHDVVHFDTATLNLNTAVLLALERVILCA